MVRGPYTGWIKLKEKKIMSIQVISKHEMNLGKIHCCKEEGIQNTKFLDRDWAWSDLIKFK